MTVSYLFLCFIGSNKSKFPIGETVLQRLYNRPIQYEEEKGEYKIL